MADEEFAELGDIQLSQFDRDNNRWIPTTHWGRSPGSLAAFNSQQHHHQHQQQHHQYQQASHFQQQQIPSSRSFQYRRPATAANLVAAAASANGGNSAFGNVRYWNNRAAEAEDIMGHYNYKTNNKQQSLYYSPPGTSYTIVEKNSLPHSTSSASQKRFLPKTPPNSTNNIYVKQTQHLLQQQQHHHRQQLPSRQQKTNVSSNTASKRAISPEQVIKLLSANSVGGRQHKNPTANNASKSPPADLSSSAAQFSTRKLPLNQSSSVNFFDEELPIRTVTMTRDITPGGVQGFGICVKGGSREPSTVGVYISRVEEGSIAEKAGLRPGDSILEVNGIPFVNISHDEALKILKSRHQITMIIKPTPLSQRLNHHGVGNSWILRHSYTWIDRLGRSVSPPPDYTKVNPNQWTSTKLSKEKVKKIELTIEPSQTLGLVIRGGIEYGLGIFVTGVDKDSVADKSGLQIGDQILDVNGTSFLDITHDEAVNFLKKQTRMTITIRDVGKIPHSCATYDSDPSWDNHRRTIRKIPRSETIQMIEEKASSVLEKSDYSTLSYYIEEYCSKNMTFDTFITVLLDLFDTTEKYTLMTELREIITAEDKPKFDEVVYQRHAQESSKSYHNPRLKSTENNYGRNSNIKNNTPSYHTRGKANKCVMEDGSTVCTQDNDGLRSPSEDSGLGLGPPEVGNGRHISSARTYRNDPGRYVEQKQLTNNVKFTSQASIEEDLGYYNQDYNDIDTESAPVPRRRSSISECVQISDKTNPSYEEANMCGYLEGLRSQLGGWTQKIKDWYWGGNSLLAHKLGQGCDINETSNKDPQSSAANRLQNKKGDSDVSCEKNAHITTDSQGNLRITIKKTKPLLGIAIEGGVNTRHPLPRIINIHEHGAAFDAGGLEVGQLILEVDRRRVEGMQHQEVARLIAENYANTDCPTIEFLVVEAKKSNMEPKPTALIFLDN